MCGIFGIINSDTNNNKLYELIKHRGPDNTIIKQYPKKYLFCFHRLCINDLSENGNQPFETDDYIVMCNGEIYNYKRLINMFNFECNGNSDCEVICKLYEIMSVPELCKLLDGVFACSIYDKKKEMLYLFRDRIGVRPLYTCINKNENNDTSLLFASEGKSLKGNNIMQLPPSTVLSYNILQNEIMYYKYYELATSNYIYDESVVTRHIRNLLEYSVKKRLISDRPIGCLLSGGLDSSLIASILSKSIEGQLTTFSVGFKDSEDLIYARKVSEYLNTKHYELILDYKDILPKIPEVIKCLETYDVTTIRASVGMYFLSKYISENHPEKVIFSGEGADEIFGGYLYFHKAPNDYEFYRESYRLVSELHYFDVLRSDRCTSNFGLELRVPFLDKDLIHYCMSLDASIRKPKDGVEKYILRQSFKNNFLPEIILNRKKEAFSDGVGGIEKPFFRHIQEYAQSLDKFKKYTLDEAEIMFYTEVYDTYYNYPPIPHMWMPNWVNVNNPSARILN